MALTWDVNNVKGAWREITRHEYEYDDGKLKMFQCPRYHDEEEDKFYEMKAEMNMLIFICGLFSGVPNITKDNYERLYERISFLESMQGSTYLSGFNPKTKERESMPMTKEMVKSAIGLKTNGVELTKSQFVKQATKNLEL